MRIFVGIDLEPELRNRIERFVQGVEGFAPEVRWVRPESWHITLKFVGEQPTEQIEGIAECLRAIEVGGFEIRVAGYGFFPTAKAARVFWIGIQSGPQLAGLAQRVDIATAEFGVPREDRAYSPHLTLARGGSGKASASPKRMEGDGLNTRFAALQKRLSAMGELDFGKMTAHEFVLYQSQASAAGAKYSRLHRFALRG